MNVRHLFFSVVFLLCFTHSNAQIVTIPDANFVTFLQTNYPSCITGDQLDTQCPDVLAETELDVSYGTISDLTGVEYFVSLTMLNCQINTIGFLPSLPPNVNCAYL